MSRLTPFGPARATQLRAALESTALLAACLALWWLASHQQWVSKVFVPTPEAAWASLRQGVLQGELFDYTQATVSRMLLGWALASALGVALGALVGNSAAARTYLQPTLEFIRPLPTSAILPLAISMFGLSGGMVLFVVAFGAMWPVLLATAEGFARMPPQLREVALALQLRPLAFACKLGLPQALPDILSGMRLSLTVSLIVSVVGEMVTSQSGLGQAILLAARAFRADDLFAGIALLGAIGFVSNAALSLTEQRFLHYQRVFT